MQEAVSAPSCVVAMTVAEPAFFAVTVIAVVPLAASAVVWALLRVATVSSVLRQLTTRFVASWDVISTVTVPLPSTARLRVVGVMDTPLTAVGATVTAQSAV